MRNETIWVGSTHLDLQAYSIFSHQLEYSVALSDNAMPWDFWNLELKELF